MLNTETETIGIFDLANRPDQPVAVLGNGTHPAIAAGTLPEFSAQLADIFRS